MTSHCVDTVQMTEESERGIRKWEEIWFKREQKTERVWAAVTCMETLCRRQYGAEHSDGQEVFSGRAKILSSGLRDNFVDCFHRNDVVASGRACDSWGLLTKLLYIGPG